MKLRKIIKSLFILLLVSLPFSCSDDPVIPYVPVYFEINIYNPDYFELQNVGNAVNVKGGVYNKGIIIYRISFDEFLAYDRTCGYHPEAVCGRVEIDDAVFNAECKCCNSKYKLSDGYPISGPSQVPLTAYDASQFDQLTGTLTVKNMY